MKSLTGLVALSLVGASPAPDAFVPGYFIPLDLVKKLDCEGPSGGVSGSGSYIDADLILTAAHVASGRVCKVDGFPAETVHVDGKLDIAVIRTAFPQKGRISISCQKPKSGDQVFAVGYAHGEDFVVQRYAATGTKASRFHGPFAGLTVFKGHGYGGMSGGPIFDGSGQMVGILNAGNATGMMMGRMLGETYLCPA